MSRIGRAQSLKSPKAQSLVPPNPLDQKDTLPASSSSFGLFSFRRSKEVKPSTTSGDSGRGSLASTSTQPTRDSLTLPSPSVLPRDSLILNAPDFQRRYFMSHESRGIALIINNKKFDRSIGQAERVGTDVDANALEDTFRNMGFTSGNIHRYNDVARRDMVRLMDHYACNTNYENMDCFFCVILSHGTDGGAIFGYDGMTTLDLLMEPFKKATHPSLVGKPKIFLIQACRGSKYDDGTSVPEKVESDGPAEGLQRIPLEADFLYAYSTVPGYFAWRNAARGSWFIDAFTKNVKKYRSNPEMDLIRLLTRVNYDVAYDYQSNVPDNHRMHRKRQMPSIVSMLTKELYFS